MLRARDCSALKSGVLLVDAYNGATALAWWVCLVHTRAYASSPPRRRAAAAVIHEWPMCAELFVAGDLAGARDALLHELQGYAAFRGACGGTRAVHPTFRRR